MLIEKANNKDAEKITELTLRSKSHWNYSKQQIEIWRDDLTITEDYILEKEVYKLTDRNKLIGYYSYFKLNEVDVKLENLFIEPRFIGQGFGKTLMTDFIQRIKKTKFKRIVLDSDPNAKKFYEQIGFREIGKLKTLIKDRFLPMMEMIIKSTNSNV